jgi:diguanylate cyclase (GGDEF)-like protein
LVARWAGDEFVFLIRECDEEGAKILMERLLARIKQFKPLDIPVTVSIGISTAVPSDETKHTLNSLFEQADSAMYKAKMTGRNGISIYQKDEG